MKRTVPTTALKSKVVDSITAGALDGLINNSLTNGDLIEDGYEAFHRTVRHLAGSDKELAARVETYSGFKLGVEIARRIIQAPLADHGEALKELIGAAVAEEREYLAEEHSAAA
jgi:hypothetical protein